MYSFNGAFTIRKILMVISTLVVLFLGATVGFRFIEEG